MFQSVTVTYRGESLELPLRWPNDAGLLLYKIDGVSPGNVEVNSQDFAILDGGIYNSARMGTRTIDLYFYYGFTPQIESARHRAYKFFPVKEQVRLDFVTDERKLSIWGYVKGNNTQIFSKQEEGQVTIECVDPYFYESSPVSYVLGSYIHEFEFPFSNESLTDPLICFSDYGMGYAYDVNYDGDVEVGAIVRIKFLEDTPTWDYIRIYDVYDNIDLEIKPADITSKTGIHFQKYDDLVFNSIRGQKNIYHERFGQQTTIIGAFDILNFPWMYLSAGKNRFSFVMDQESDYGKVQISIEHSGAYGGV